MISKTTKADKLWCAKLFFKYMEKSKTKFGKRFWERYMYEELFAWAGWKE